MLKGGLPVSGWSSQLVNNSMVVCDLLTEHVPGPVGGGDTAAVVLAGELHPNSCLKGRLTRR